LGAGNRGHRGCLAAVLGRNHLRGVHAARGDDLLQLGRTGRRLDREKNRAKPNRRHAVLRGAAVRDGDAGAVHTQIEIAASPETVWNNIKRVPPISREEQKFSWSQAIGFPAPIEATLSEEAVGGVRHASFARGVVFIETVRVWEPRQRLMFSIHADPATIPPTALDEHVTVGGPYFDVLEGEYRIESAGPGRVMLHLTSRHRLSTTLNFYASLWSDRVMRDVQENILWVIKNRSERR
jgi:hypothetical protein